MDNNKAFTTYAILIAAGVLSVLSASVMAGDLVLPTPLVFLEHVSLSLLFRAAYHSLDGPYGLFGPTHAEVELAEMERESAVAASAAS